MMFILNGIALSFVESASPLAGKQVTAQHMSRNSAPQPLMVAATRGG